MITLTEIKDWLKTMDVAENYYIGKLDNKKDKSLGVYSRTRSGPPVTALGGLDKNSYDIKAVTLLLHWNNNANETETAALRFWEKLRKITDLSIEGKHIQYLSLLVPEPQNVGTDEKGVYEYVIDIDLYERR